MMYIQYSEVNTLQYLVHQVLRMKKYCKLPFTIAQKTTASKIENKNLYM